MKRWLVASYRLRIIFSWRLSIVSAGDFGFGALIAANREAAFPTIIIKPTLVRRLVRSARPCGILQVSLLCSIHH